MSRFRDTALRKIASIGPRYLPFADVATEAVPLSRFCGCRCSRSPSAWRWCCLVGTLNRVHDRRAGRSRFARRAA